MDEREAQRHWLSEVRARARHERRLAGPPLLACGLLVSGLGPVTDWGTPAMVASYWLVGGPAVFVLLRRWYDRHADRRGIGTDSRPYGVAGVAVGLGLLWGPLNLIAPLAALGAGLGFVALRQANRTVLLAAVGVVVCGVLGVSFLDNRVYDVMSRLGWGPGGSGYVTWAPVAVYGLLGAAMLGTGLRRTSGERT